MVIYLSTGFWFLFANYNSFSFFWQQIISRVIFSVLLSSLHFIAYSALIHVGCFCYFGHAKELRDYFNQGRLPLSTRELKMLFFSHKTKLYIVCLYLHRTKKGLSSSVFITWRWLLNPQNGSLCSHPPASICRSACEDLLPWWQRGSMWRGDVFSYGALLISPLSSQGCAEGQPHNRMIHHAGLVHLSHV